MTKTEKKTFKFFYRDRVRTEITKINLSNKGNKVTVMKLIIVIIMYNKINVQTYKTN